MAFNINLIKPKHIDFFFNNAWRNVKRLYYDGVLVWAERIGKELSNKFPIIIPDSYESHNLSAYEIQGNSKQLTYNGNQLIPYPHRSGQRIINGITFTSNSDGTVTIDGTATNDADYYLYGNWASRNNTLFANMSDITLSISGSSYVRLVVYTFGDNGMRGTSTLNATTFNIQSHDGCCIYLHIDNGMSFNNLVVHPMINDGSILKPIEPYVGAKPSPSVEYPQEVIHVGDKVNSQYIIPIEISGRNMFNKNAVSEHYYISDADGFLNYDENMFTSEYIPIGHNLHISCESYQDGDNFRYAFYDEHYAPITVGLGLYAKINTVGILGNAKYVRVSAPISFVDTLQVEDDESSNGYTPYVEPIIINITLDEPLRAIGNVRDIIRGGLEQSSDGTYYMVGEIERKIRHLELNVSDMNNTNENWAGWKGDIVSVVRNDYFNVDYYFKANEIQCNFSVPKDNLLGINTLNNDAIIFIHRDAFNNRKQSEWKTNYANFVMDINYVKETSSVEQINLPLIEIPKGYVKLKVLTNLDAYGTINYYGMA